MAAKNYPPEHGAWHGMKQRCYNPKNKDYPQYGGRGIKVCPEWLGRGSFARFLADVGPRPSSDHRLDRKDPAGDYSADNCRWLTRSDAHDAGGSGVVKQYASPRKSAKLSTRVKASPSGEDGLYMSELARVSGVNLSTLRYRIRSGMDPKLALLAPVGKKYGVNRETLPEYHSWLGMRKRCCNPNNKNYKDYGGRGIKICEEWGGPSGFDRFFSFMGPKPTPQHQLDRRDNDGDYSPENCHWVTPAENVANRRSSSPRILLNGESLTLVEWCRRYRIHRATVESRLARGFDLMLALTMPLRSVKRENLRLGAGYGV